MNPPPDVRERFRGRYGASGILAPRAEGFADHDGVRLAFQVFGDSADHLVLLPGWQIFHSRMWKFQVPYLARYFSVITFDARGSGRSDRPAAGYDHDTLAVDALTVLDAVGVDRVVLVGHSVGASHAIVLAAEHPRRVSRLVLLTAAPSQAAGPDREQRRREVVALFHQEHDRYTGWAKLNANYFRRDYPGWLEFFIGQMLPEPHSTKAVADAWGWGLDGDAEVLIRARDEWWSRTPFPELLARIEAPILFLHGGLDRITSYAANAPFLQRAVTRSVLVQFEGSGHVPHLHAVVPEPGEAGPDAGGRPEIRGFVPDLYEHLACCDAALVQGGLTTCMELVALGRPFISFPLRNHFEQRFHVARRLARYGHTAEMDYRDLTPERLAAAVRGRLAGSARYLPVAGGGAGRAAAMIRRVLA